MLRSKKFNIILALIAAIVLWGYVLGEINPTSSTVVRKVPISFLNEEALEEEGLTILGVSAETVNVTISGQRTAITRAEAGDFSVTADVEALKPGENTVRINVTGPRGVEIERTNIDKITVTVDKKASEEKPVEAVVTGETGKDKEVSVKAVERESAVVSGPASLVDKVEKLAAYIKVDDIGSKLKTLSVEMVPTDGNGTKVEGLTIEGGTKNNITVIMLSKKTVKLNVPVSGLDAGGAEREVSLPETVVIKGSEEALADVSVINCRELELNDVNESVTLSLTPILPDGVELSEESGNLTAQITVREVGSKTFDFTSDDVILTVKTSGLNYKISDAVFKVTVTGKESVLNELAKSDIVLSADTEGLDIGIHNLGVSIDCEKDVLTVEITPSRVEVVIE